jgi:hypothetical protein
LASRRSWRELGAFAFVALCLSIFADTSRAQAEKATIIPDVTAERSEFKRELTKTWKTAEPDFWDLVDVLKIMDRAVLRELNEKKDVSTAQINEELEKWKLPKKSPADLYQGSYEIFALQPNRSYVLIANFYVISALRVYARHGEEGTYRLAARLDPIVYQEYLNMSPLEFRQIDKNDGVFLTIHGREYRRSSWGSYAAWRFDGDTVKELWNSNEFLLCDIEARGIIVTHCKSLVRPDGTCDAGLQERYAWADGKWQRLP